jgi:hypothetical protein
MTDGQSGSEYPALMRFFQKMADSYDGLAEVLETGPKSIIVSLTPPSGSKVTASISIPPGGDGLVVVSRGPSDQVKVSALPSAVIAVMLR